MGAGRGEKGCGVTASAGEDNGKGCEGVEEGREEGSSDVKRGECWREERGRAEELWEGGPGGEQKGCGVRGRWQEGLGSAAE